MQSRIKKLAVTAAVIATTDLQREQLVKGGKYNWKCEPTRLVYLGYNFSGNGYWHQFAKVESPEIVWCEVLDRDLHMLEATKDGAP